MTASGTPPPSSRPRPRTSSSTSSASRARTARRDPAEPVKTAVSDFGLEVQPITPELAKSLDLPAGVKGLLVSQVKEGSAADAEGIKEGDLITKVVRNRRIQPLTSVKDFQDLASKSDELSFYVQSGKAPGRFVTLTKTKK